MKKFKIIFLHYIRINSYVITYGFWLYVIPIFRLSIVPKDYLLIFEIFFFYFLFLFSFVLGPLPLVKVLKDKIQTFSFMGKNNLVSKAIMSGFLIQLPWPSQ